MCAALRWWTAGLAAVGGPLGCSVTFDTPPAAQLSCETNDDCPADQRCSTGLGTCVTGDAEDIPPTLSGTPVLDPPTVRPGEVVTVTFTVSEALAKAPSLDLEGGDEVFVPGSVDGETYSFSTAIDPGASDGNRAVTAALVDLAGNSTPPLTLGTLIVDGTAPILVADSLSPSRFGAAGVLDITFTTSEPVEIPEVEVTFPAGRGATASFVSATGATQFSFSAAAIPGDGSGAVLVLVTLRDDAGNTREVQLDGATLDATPPEVQSDSIDISITPPVGRPSVDATRLTTGSHVRLSFTLSETVSVAPAPDTDLGASWTRTSDDGASRWVYELELSAGANEGLYPVSAVVEDDVGNGATLDLGTLIVDNTPPDPIDVDTEDLVLFERHPWGTIDGGGARLELVVGIGALLPEPVLSDERTPVSGALATLLVCAGVAGCGQPGSVVVTTTLGEPPPVLILTVPQDTPSLAVAAVDRAGNVSPIREVRDIRHTMVPLPDIGHPHRAARTSMLSSSYLLQQTTDADDDPLATTDGVSLRSGVDAYWTKQNGPGELDGAAMVYNSVWDELLLFGGRDPTLGCGSISAYCGQTWRSNGAGPWTVAATTGPSNRYLSAMGYDPKTGVVILHGGRDTTGALSDTWSWNGTWTQLDPGGVSDPTAAAHTIVYDVERRRFLMVACMTNPLRTWNTTTNNWDVVTVTGLSIGCGTYLGNASDTRSAVAYDPDRDVLVAQTGSAWSEVNLSTMAVTTTTIASPPGPEPRGGATLVYDTRRRGMLLHGGDIGASNGESCEGSGSRYCPTAWLYAGGAWTALESEIVGAGDSMARANAAYAFDRQRGELVVVGGYSTVASGNTQPLDGAWRLETDGRPATLVTASLAAAGATEPLAWFINFEPSGVTTPAGYLADNGTVYGPRGGGLSYGWETISGTVTNDDPSSQAKLASNLADPDLRYRTLMHVSTFSGSWLGRWRMALPADTYDVAMVSGDAMISGTYCLEVSGGGAAVPIVDATVSPPTFVESELFDLDVVDEVSVQTCETAWYSKVNFLHLYPHSTNLERVRIRAETSARGFIVDPRLATTVDSLGGSAVAYTPTVYDIPALVGTTGARRYTLRVLNNSGTLSGVLDEWCITLDGGSPQCRAPGVSLSPGQRWHDVLDLGATSAGVLTDFDLYVDISHANAAELSIGFTADEATRASLPGAKLSVLGPFDWEELATNDAALGTPALLEWDSDASAFARPLSRLVSGVDNRLRLAITPRGTSGDALDTAVSSTDSLRVEVELRLP